MVKIKISIKNFIGIMIIIFLFSYRELKNDFDYYYVKFLYATIPFVNYEYNHQKSIVKNSFDEKFYIEKYEKEVKKYNISPLDHFMLVGWKGNWKTSCDPNRWFNVTLYKEHLWPTHKNPFWDFLNQPKLIPPPNAETAIVYITPKDEQRAWMAAEALLRANTHKVKIVLGKQDYASLPPCFSPMVPRGLIVEFKDGPGISFYKSPFLKDPSKYTNLQSYPTEIKDSSAVVYVNKNEGQYLLHRLYRCTKWYEKGILNPLILNVGKYTDEPLFLSPFGKTEAEFKAQMQRLAPGFDLLFTGIEVGTQNNRIIPGYMATWVNQLEISKTKTFAVSFLLSLGGKGSTTFSNDESKNYSIRKALFEHEKDIKIPTYFYISKRDIKKYPDALKNRVLPTDSKKWIFQSQFNIVIENTNQINYFTEKLLGCFESETIPIYIGCPNIGDYFDIKGILIAKSLDGIVQIINSLTPETYQKMLPHILENKRRMIILLNKFENDIKKFIQINF